VTTLIANRNQAYRKLVVYFMATNFVLYPFAVLCGDDFLKNDIWICIFYCLSLIGSRMWSCCLAHFTFKHKALKYEGDTSQDQWMTRYHTVTFATGIAIGAVFISFRIFWPTQLNLYWYWVPIVMTSVCFLASLTVCLTIFRSELKDSRNRLSWWLVIYPLVEFCPLLHFIVTSSAAFRFLFYLQGFLNALSEAIRWKCLKLAKRGVEPLIGGEDFSDINSDPISVSDSAPINHQNYGINPTSNVTQEPFGDPMAWGPMQNGPRNSNDATNIHQVSGPYHLDEAAQVYQGNIHSIRSENF